MTRQLFDELMASNRPGYNGTIEIDDAESVFVDSVAAYGPANILLVRRLKPSDIADVKDDYVRVYIHDVDGVLRMTATTAEERAFVDEMTARLRPALEAMLQKRKAKSAKAVAGAPRIDRAALEDAVRAMTYGRVDSTPIVEDVLSAAKDPRGYVASHAAVCAKWGIHDPVEGLHVIALLQRLPPGHLLYFDWKEAMYDVLPMLADLLRAGPGLAFDVARFIPRCDAWDRRSRRGALKELAAAIDGAVLLEIKTDGDAYSVVCVAPGDAARLRTWTKKAGLPLATLAKRGA